MDLKRTTTLKNTEIHIGGDAGDRSYHPDDPICVYIISLVF
jgi:hypothetical protein